MRQGSVHPGGGGSGEAGRRCGCDVAGRGPAWRVGPAERGVLARREPARR